MTSNPIRRLQELATELRVGQCPRLRATKEANLAGCLSERNQTEISPSRSERLAAVIKRLAR